MSVREIGAYRQLFPKGYIPCILLSVTQAGSTLRKNTNSDKEDWITRRLYARLIKIPEFRDGPLDIRMQPEVISSDSDANTPSGKIDLLVSCGFGYEVYFAIEAKRLRVCLPNGRVIYGSNEYVMKGMMRFITGQYAPNMEAGAMLGYVFDGEIDKARSGVMRSIQNKSAKLKLAFPERLIRSSVLTDVHIDESHHNLIKRSFTIYHVFITV